MPIAPLMIEHRLIEKMVAIIRRESGRVSEGKKLEEEFVDTVVDFIRSYADRTHHGKEEDILFIELGKRDISADDRQMMQELVDEHMYTRNVVRELVEAKKLYFAGNPNELGIILEKLATLVSLYPAHILKEDKVFFPAAMKYFSKSEQEAMLEAMWKFDRELIHEKYRLVVAHLD